MSKENLWPEPSMMLVTGNWGPMKTFKLIPVTKDCPYIECIFNPAIKLLAVIGTHKKDQFHMVERLNDDGEPRKRKVPTKDEEYQKQRVTVETFSEYYVQEKDEIETFIKHFAVNAKDFDYTKFLNAPGMEAPSESGIETPPIILKP